MDQQELMLFKKTACTVIAKDLMESADDLDLADHEKSAIVMDVLVASYCAMGFTLGLPTEALVKAVKLSCENVQELKDKLGV